MLNPTPVQVLRSRMAVPVSGDQPVTLIPLTAAGVWHATCQLCRQHRGPSGRGVQELGPSSARDEHAAPILLPCSKPEPPLPSRCSHTIAAAGRRPTARQHSPARTWWNLEGRADGAHCACAGARGARTRSAASSVSLNLVSAEAASSPAPPTSCCQFWSRLSPRGSSSASDHFAVVALKGRHGQVGLSEPQGHRQ